MRGKAAIRIAAICLTLTIAGIAPAQQYNFQYFGVEQGLTNLAVKTMFQDRTGFIWVGTENGVFRYEGVRFREFSAERGLPLSVSMSIGEAPDGSVLVGNQWGLFQLRGERFEKVALPAGHRINGYHGIARSGNSTYLATDSGLLLASLNTDGTLLLRRGPAPPDLLKVEARSVYADGREILWGCGVSLCRSENGTVTATGEASGLKAAQVLAITRDKQGNLWVEQNRRLLVMGVGRTQFEDADTQLPSTGTGSPQVDSEGRLLVPTTLGLAIRENGNFRIAGRPEGLLPPVYSVLQDREGSVWLGLAGRGLAKWLGYDSWESFSSQSGLTGETVYEILPVAGGTVWAGTEVGLFRGNRVKGQWVWRQENALGSVPVHAVRSAGQGRLWLGTDVHGAALFNPATRAVKWYGAVEGLAGLSTHSVFVDKDGVVWAGTELGLFTMGPAETAFHKVTEVPSLRCWALDQAPNGDMWAATAEGIWQRSNGNWRQFTTADGLRSKAVLSIAAGKSGDVWIGYRLTGTVTRLHFEKNRPVLEHYETGQGRGIDVTYFLGFDAKERLWAGTNLGIQVMNGGHWDSYDHRDGLIWDDCDLHAFASEPDGHLWIGTSGGLSRFLPRAAQVQPEPPRTVFTSVALGKKELDPARKLTLDYSSDPLLARFTALRFGRDRDIAFRYRLDDAKPWSETRERELQFPALPPGAYRLEVEARDAASGWSNVPAVFEFTVNAPWWATWWFTGASVSGVALSAGLFWRRRNRRQDAIRHELEKAVSERTQELSHQYRHDVLTGLPNRLLFRERLNTELLAARERGTGVAVLFIDLDRFKRINDTWGHHTGDLFLRKIAERLLSGLKSTETIGRIGGDEFIVLIPGLHDRREAEIRGWDLLRTLDSPIEVESKNVFATMSVGIATFPEDANTAAALMAASDAAMYRAKGAGKNQVQLFEAGMMEAASRPQNIEDRLREALKKNAFKLYYQPQYTLDGCLEGFEALIRIHGSEHELGPAEFIPIAEESGLIVELGGWVLREACAQVRLWHLSGFPDVRIAVNVSVVQLAHTGFEEYVLKVLEETGINPHRLEFEITETALVKDTGDSADLLNRIRRRGICVALDDFGTGYSPMRYLHQLPVDVVKIDQVFVRDLDGTPSSVPLVEGMVKLAKTLSLKVVAEGCETQAQFELLRRIGFDVAQGNLLSRPVGPERAEALLREDKLLRAASAKA